MNRDANPADDGSKGLKLGTLIKNDRWLIGPEFLWEDEAWWPKIIDIPCQPRPQGFSLKKWVGRKKALASAGYVHSLNILEKLIYMQPAGFALTEVERSNNGK